MNAFLGGSRKTRIVFLALFLSQVCPAFAGTDGSPNSELQKREDDVAEAKNKLDTLLIKSKNRDDPKVKEAEAELQAKQKELQTFFQSGLVRKGGAAVPNGTKEKPESAPKEPEMVLSGEGIQSEITYSKKGKKPSPKAEVEPSSTPTGIDDGISEIRYQSKKK